MVGRWRGKSLLVVFVALLASTSAHELTDAHLCGGGRHSCFLNGTRSDFSSLNCELLFVGGGADQSIRLVATCT